MTEFNSSGFSNVNSFFDGGSSIDLPKSEERNKIAISRGKRAGLGVQRENIQNSSQKTNGVFNNQTSKKIMNIGRKSSQKDLDTDVVNGDSEVDDSDVDEEEGRTSTIKDKVIIPRAEKVDVPSHNEHRPPAKKKKKLGRKERLAAAEEKGKIECQGDRHDKDGNRSVNGNDCSKDANTSVQPSLKETKVGQIKKRKKVRSKQKNIRKDHRDPSQKPDHLIIGSKNYAGRPLTKETKDKLQLPQNKSSGELGKKSFRSSWINQQTLTKNYNSNECEDTSLGVDKFVTSKSKIEILDSKSKTKTKVKLTKRKYKNLN
mmetsp:Transcript_8340/g.11903  ORF Transcript_8340/g.11903 Transcript_8340/m.11903 type:complete len:316 (-) Transcript_8340:88-1035(-)|eukprot:CAMPEP_0184864060 /NCGR_PEP_ID=MMETSP0580-20130426/13534_1 /TAXON_ID=1118495 /ORGANISM="Dactyliosolen fragilissimus" /LENGTH=315 /DNA_ID=CAMNT_0027362691 /DNA_START=191 /DNA_END=1138 /DNA_ORIENTATION=+